MTKQRGDWAEDLAAAFLTRHGLRVIVRNYRCRSGEIDLVLRDGTALVFAEVRMRHGKNFGGAAESITAAKQRRIIHAARHYLAGFGNPPPCRFDAVLLTGSHDIEWIRDAFGE